MGLKNGPWIFLTAERVEKAVGDSVTVSCSSTSIVSSGQGFLEFSNLLWNEKKTQFIFLYYAVEKLEENLLFSLTSGVKRITSHTDNLICVFFSQINFSRRNFSIDKIEPLLKMSEAKVRLSIILLFGVLSRRLGFQRHLAHILNWLDM